MTLPPVSGSVLGLLIETLRTPNRQVKSSLAGRTCLITGSNSGIGLATAHLLPTLGVSHLVMSVRSIVKGEEAAAPIRKAHPKCKVDVWELDMLSYPSIQAFAKRCETLPHLDMAILNAGIAAGDSSSRPESSTMHEETFQVNYLSTSLLAILLLPLLAANTTPGRLTIVGSGTAAFAVFANRNARPLIPSFDIPFTGFAAGGERYALSKLLVMMLVHKLGTTVPASKVIVNTVEPGLTSGTRLHRNATGASVIIFKVLKILTSKTVEQAAWTYVDAVATKGAESHGGSVMFWDVKGWPKIMYGEEGRKVMDALWEETVGELSSVVDVDGILRAVGKSAEP
jgi:NAD(P)-dependent dehydrogenase (short-subunit alcohol dehydrogenase family)